MAGFIRSLFESALKTNDALEMAVVTGCLRISKESIFTGLNHLTTNSVRDGSFAEGFLYGTPDYQPQSNREEGDGRPDIVLYPENPKDPAIIFELKVRKKFNEMEDGLNEAYDQIKTKKYEEGVLEDGYMGVKSYGICFCKKSCIVGKLLKY